MGAGTGASRSTGRGCRRTTSGRGGNRGGNRRSTSNRGGSRRTR